MLEKLLVTLGCDGRRSRNLSTYGSLHVPTSFRDNPNGGHPLNWWTLAGTRIAPRRNAAKKSVWSAVNRENFWSQIVQRASVENTALH